MGEITSGLSGDLGQDFAQVNIEIRLEEFRGPCGFVFSDFRKTPGEDDRISFSVVGCFDPMNPKEYLEAIGRSVEKLERALLKVYGVKKG